MAKIYLNGVDHPKPGPVPDIEGCITDSSGQPVVDVEVSASNGTETYTTTTGADGCYDFRPDSGWDTVTGSFDVLVNDPGNTYVPPTHTVTATNTGAVTADFQQD